MTTGPLFPNGGAADRLENSNRVPILVGPGGDGTTRLAVQQAEHFRTLLLH